MRAGAAFSFIGRAAAFLFLGFATQALAQTSPGVAPRQAPPLSGAPYKVEPFASGLSHPWGMAFLPDGRLLVTEREGRARIIAKDGTLGAPLTGLPQVYARGQGGLLDVALDPDFAQNRRVYFSFAEPRPQGAATAVARAELNDEKAFSNVSILFRQEPAYSGSNHFGSRLAFGKDKTLFITTGDRFDLSEKAQDLSTTLGKVIRLTGDGAVPADNPFVEKGASSMIWSYGHRNVQAAAIEPSTGRLFTIEHGARGGDEVNISAKGRNYGWPIISYGVHYSGRPIGEGQAKDGMEQPIYYWDPSIAPSGATFYTGEAFPAWRGSLFVGALAGQSLVRLTLDGDRVTGEERFPLGKRVRDVVQGPDGALYLAIDADAGEIVRIVPQT